MHPGSPDPVTMCVPYMLMYLYNTTVYPRTAQGHTDGLGVNIQLEQIKDLDK